LSLASERPFDRGIERCGYGKGAKPPGWGRAVAATLQAIEPMGLCGAHSALQVR